MPKSSYNCLFLRFDDVSCLSKTKSLIELSLDGNPFANNAGYKQSVLQNVTTLKQLDMKRLTVNDVIQ